MTSAVDREIIISRLISAPRELVWRAWTDPNHVDAWWGPNGFRNETLHMDVKPDGMWRYIMHGPNGMKFPNRVKYIEVHAPVRLVYEHGDDVDEDPMRFDVKVDLIQRNGSTEVIMNSLFPTALQRNMVVEKYGAIEGGKQTLARLEQHLKTAPSSINEP
ncbi:MAG: SRPBCC family protein [Flavobacteriales bacterium]